MITRISYLSLLIIIQYLYTSVRLFVSLLYEILEICICTCMINDERNMYCNAVSIYQLKKSTVNAYTSA